MQWEHGGFGEIRMAVALVAQAVAGQQASGTSPGGERVALGTSSLGMGSVIWRKTLEAEREASSAQEEWGHDWAATGSLKPPAPWQVPGDTDPSRMAHASRPAPPPPVPREVV